MESPQTSNLNINGGDLSLPKLNCTPKNHRNSRKVGGELGLYNLHRESSPNFRAGQDALEVGWGDSPEPLNVESKHEINRTPVMCKKKLETKESPKSSISFRRRNLRSIPSKSIIDVSKYVAEVQELSKNIMKEFNTSKIEKDISENENLVSRNELVDNNFKYRKPSTETEIKKDLTFDSVIQSFINEEDDWLSQALSSQEQLKSPHKSNFVKSKSENELKVPPSEKPCLSQQNLRNVYNNFRRTSSFDLTKPQNKYTNQNEGKNRSSSQYSVQDIERKRLEAKYRRERREIERKKLEALKRLELKKLRVIKT